MLQKESELGDGAEGDKQNSALTFMDMPVVIAVKYIEGNALESMGIDFYPGNAGVNTSAIELLETLINYIDNPDNNCIITVIRWLSCKIAIIT